MSSGPLKIGLIGTGYWADACHATGIDHNADLEFEGVWGRNADAAAELAARHGTKSFELVGELFEAVDVVTFAVPPSVQAPLAVRAAKAGCHLLLEKPIAVSSADAKAIVDAVTTAGVQSAVNFSLLWGGATGPWLDSVVIPGEWDGGGATILGDLRVTDGPFSASPWRRADNGALWDVGPHTVSLLVAALGPIVDVHGEHGHGDAFVLSARHESGAVSTSTTSYTLGAGAGRFGLEFWGPSGLTTPPAGDPDATPADNIAPALAALVRSIRSGEPTRYDAAFGAEIVDILERAEQSATH